ncbi:MAG TPA: HAD-IIB family hydrolase [Microlunatus sp.]|nr:HAD-IIB family hydrolase [Microlunatus sp.]
MRWYRAIALDLDGTLTLSGPPEPALLAAIDDIRHAGVRVILVTGRILAELQAEQPGVAEHFDVVVAENGAVLRTPTWSRRLAEPVDAALLAWLRDHGVAARAGEVIIATDVRADHRALDAVETLHLEVQLVRNRSALMLLPGGVSKGTGLLAALHELGISRHNTLAVGDAENDHSMLAAAELGVAVGNAVEAVRTAADLVLPAADGAGVLELLRGPVVTGDHRAVSAHRRIVLGADADGTPVTLPAAQTNVLISGSSESGKSYLAGLIIEQLLALEYTMLIIDPEGDHICLGQLPGVLLLSGHGLPPPDTVAELYAQGVGAVILDLSGLGDERRSAYLGDLWPTVLAARAESAVPHWIVVEEAQSVQVCRGAGGLTGTGWWGLCLVSYQPDVLPPDLHAAMEWQVSTGTPGGGAVLTTADGRVRRFRMAPRWTRHVRHWHKYTDSPLPSPLRFTFTRRGRPISAPVGTLREFVAALDRAPATVIASHARRGDMSRWLREQYRDHVAAGLVATAERDLFGHGDPERTRRQIGEILRLRYLTGLPAA